MSLEIGQWSLDGITFGTPNDDIVILSGGLDTGTSSVRDQDNAFHDMRLMGRDYLDAPTYAFSLGVKTKAALDELITAWRADDIRTQPGRYKALYFNRFGEENVVFGRPRRFAVVPSDIEHQDWFMVEADFQLMDSLIYSGNLHSLRMGLIETQSTGGVVLPQALPWELRAGDGSRKGIVTVEGYTSTPLTVRIYGPKVAGTLSNPTIKAPGFYVRLNKNIAANQMVEIDTRTRTVMSDGISFAGYLSADSRLGTKLLPGSTEFTFSGTDPSYTSEVEFLWRSAQYSI